MQPNLSITESVESANIIRLLSSIVVKYFIDYRKKNPQIDTKTITYRTLFRDYIDHPTIGGFIKQLFGLLSKEGLNSAGVEYKRNTSYRSLSNSQRGEDDSTNGGFDPDGLDIYLFNFDTIERTISHELSHLYDYVVSKNERFDNRTGYKDPLNKDLDKRASFDEYYNQEMEVRARVMAEVAKYLDTWGADDLMTDIADVVKSVPNNLKKKYVSLVYKIADSAKRSGVDKIAFIEKAPKVVPTTEEKLNSLFANAGVTLTKRTGDDGKPRYTLDSGVLSVMSIDDSGNVTYPLLDSFMTFYSKNKSMRFVANNAYLSYVIRKTYGMTEYENNSGYRRSVIDDNAHFKHSKLKSDSIVPDDRRINNIINKLGNDSSMYPISVLTNLMATYKIPDHDKQFALNIIAGAIKKTVSNVLSWQHEAERTGKTYATSPFKGVAVDSEIWNQIEKSVGEYPINRLRGNKDGREYVILCGRPDEIKEYYNGTLIESNAFTAFVSHICDGDRVLCESILSGYSVIFGD